MDARSRLTTRTEDLRLSCWNADGVRGRKLELDHFIEQHGIDIVDETHLRSGESFRIANYVCHRTYHLTEEGGTAILVPRGIYRDSVPVQSLNARRLLPSRSSWLVNR